MSSQRHLFLCDLRRSGLGTKTWYSLSDQSGSSVIKKKSDLGHSLWASKHGIFLGGLSAFCTNILCFDASNFSNLMVRIGSWRNILGEAGTVKTVSYLWLAFLSRSNLSNTIRWRSELSWWPVVLAIGCRLESCHVLLDITNRNMTHR